MYEITADHNKILNDTQLRELAELIDVGRELLINPDAADRSKRNDYAIASIARVCLKGKDGTDVARTLCTALAEKLRKRTGLDPCDELFDAVLTTQASAFFGALLEPDGSINEKLLLGFAVATDRNPIRNVKPEHIVAWCKKDPGRRFSQLTQLVPLAVRSEPDAPLTWSPSAPAILARAPDFVGTLKVFVKRLDPVACEGSRADHIRENLALLADLDPGQLALAGNYVVEATHDLSKRARKESEFEQRLGEDEDGHDERFE